MSEFINSLDDERVKEMIRHLQRNHRTPETGTTLDRWASCFNEAGHDVTGCDVVNDLLNLLKESAGRAGLAPVGTAVVVLPDGSRERRFWWGDIQLPAGA